MACEPCRLEGGVIVRAVYAADLYSVVLRDANARSTHDDLTVRLIDVRTKTVRRRGGEPPTGRRIFDGKDRDSEDWAPCAAARDAAEKAIGSRDCRVIIPVAGRGFLERLMPGTVVDGFLFIWNRGDWQSLSDVLFAAGHVSKFAAQPNRDHGAAA
ncbi:MAG: hypothetical protein AAF958_01415 [Planctomycetota bacterium]